MLVGRVATVGVCLCCGVGCCGGGRCRGPLCGRNIGSDGRCGSSRRNTGWHIWLSAQTAIVVIDIVKGIVMPGEIMVVSMDFVVKALELINLLGFYFVMVMVFNSVDEKSGPV